MSTASTGPSSAQPPSPSQPTPNTVTPSNAPAASLSLQSAGSYDLRVSNAEKVYDELSKVIGSTATAIKWLSTPAAVFFAIGCIAAGVDSYMEIFQNDKRVEQLRESTASAQIEVDDLKEKTRLIRGDADTAISSSTSIIADLNSANSKTETQLTQLSVGITEAAELLASVRMNRIAADRLLIEASSTQQKVEAEREGVAELRRDVESQRLAVEDVRSSVAKDRAATDGLIAELNRAQQELAKQKEDAEVLKTSLDQERVKLGEAQFEGAVFTYCQATKGFVRSDDLTRNAEVFIQRVATALHKDQKERADFI